MAISLRKKSIKTNAKTWTKHVNDQPGRVIHPIVFTGPAELFCLNIFDKEIKEMIDVHGNVCFSKIFEWMLPMFDCDSFYVFFWQGCATLCCTASKTKGGSQSTIILSTRRSSLLTVLHTYFGCQLVQSLRGNPSIDSTWSTPESLDAIGTCMECIEMPSKTSIPVFILRTIGMGTTNG